MTCLDGWLVQDLASSHGIQSVSDHFLCEDSASVRQLQSNLFLWLHRLPLPILPSYQPAEVLLASLFHLRGEHRNLGERWLHDSQPVYTLPASEHDLHCSPHPGVSFRLRSSVLPQRYSFPRVQYVP